MKDIIEQFKKHKVLVIGDAILDMYIKGVTDRICREAPVPVIDVQEEEFDCGGAANTAINVAALGAEVCFLSVIGNDDTGKALINALKEKGVLADCLIMDNRRKTLAKKRIVASSNILLRIDEGNSDAISAETQEILNNRLKEIYDLYDAIILSDYEYGLVNESLIDTVERLRVQKRKTLVVDSKDLSKFKRLNPDGCKPNYEETVKLLKLPKLLHTDRVEQVLENGKQLLEVTGAESVAATLDADGTIVFQKGKKPYRIYSEPQLNSKAIGAGDTFIAALTLAIQTGAEPQIAAEIAAAAASIILEKEGTVVCTNGELKNYFNENAKYLNDLNDLNYKISELRKEGKRIVFTNGCFDILHRGHVNFLNQAKMLGDVLVVGINNDESIRRVKGNERPINTLEDRIEVLSALQSVDYLISFEEDTSAELVKTIHPDVFVKGGTYSIESIPEALLVKQLGGEVKIIHSAQSHSTTQIIHKIKGASLHPGELKEKDQEYAKASGLE